MVVLAVALQQGPEITSRYARENGLSCTILPDPNGEVNTKYRVFMTPEVFFIDPNGILRQKEIGYMSKATIVSKFKLTRQLAS